MIREINIHNIATYVKPVSMRPLSINFVYGSNGSGKSTLANLLHGDILTTGSNVVWDNNNRLQVLVYNKGFVEATFGISSPINGVFTLGEDSKEAQEFIAQKREEVKACGDLIEKQTGSITKLKQEQANLDSNLDDTCWAVQRKYGAEFSEALVGYRGNKRSFRNRCLQEYPNLNATPLPELQEIRDLYRAAYGERRDEYHFYHEIDEAEVKQQEECPLLAQRISGSSETPIGKFIEFLNNSDWVKQGIGYVEKADGKCPYCQQPLSPSVQQNIEAFFDETYEKDCAVVRTYQMQYEAFTRAMLSKLRSIHDNSIPLLDYVLFKSEVDVLDAAIEVNKKIIQDKIASPSTLVRIDSVEPIVQRIGKLIRDFNSAIKRNNEIVRNQAAEKDRCKKLLWQYFTNELRQPIQQYKKNYDGKTGGIYALYTKNKEQSDKKGEIEKQIEEKEATLTSVIPTVNAINGILRRFGFEGFYLAENTETRGTYKIIRPDGTSARKTLSEGEYNFITFLYFYHLVYGSQDKTGILADKVVVIDDPISSLDSNVLFVVTTLIRAMLQDCKDGKNGVKQMFILTHNVYFHKEFTFLGSRKQYPTSKTAYWVLKKTNNITDIVHYDSNPIQTSYELLWYELKDPDAQLRITIFNTLRRILEYYFNVIGGMDYEECINKFEGEEKIICKALISCINEGSHFISDDFVMCYESETLDNYLRVFRLIFEKMEHGSHYRMMMGKRHGDDSHVLIDARTFPMSLNR